MAEKTTFARMSERPPLRRQAAKEIAELENNLRKAGVPERFWRYDLPADPRLPGIHAYNRGVDYWNALIAEQQKRINSICTRKI